MKEKPFDIPKPDDLELIFAFEEEIIKLNRLSFFIQHDTYDRTTLFQKALTLNKDFHFITCNLTLLECLELLQIKVSLLEKVHYINKKNADSKDIKWLWTQIFKLLNNLQSEIDFIKTKEFGEDEFDEKTFYTSDDYKNWRTIKDEVSRQSQEDRLNVGESFPSIYNKRIEDGFDQ